jgi:hypothetical protein
MKHEKNIEKKLWLALLFIIIVALLAATSCAPKNHLYNAHQRDFYIHKVEKDKVIVLKHRYSLSDTIFKEALMEIPRSKDDTLAMRKGFLIDNVTRNVLIRY